MTSETSIWVSNDALWNISETEDLWSGELSNTHVKIEINFDIVACSTVATQRSWDMRLYQFGF
jgi:hypothetical protein